MNFRQYIALMTISGILAWLTLGFILFGITPYEAGLGIFFLFYISLLLALACTFSILGLIIRVWILKKQNTPYQAGKSFRQAMLLASLIAGLLYFQSKDILNWWTIILSILVLTLIEFFLISHKTKFREA